MTDQHLWLSHFLSYVLRHAPVEMGCGLTRGGWARMRDVLETANRDTSHMPVTVAHVVHVVEAPRRRRFALFYRGGAPSHIRALHGHTITRAVNGEALDISLMYAHTSGPLSPVTGLPQIALHLTRHSYVRAMMQGGLLLDGGEPTRGLRVIPTRRCSRATAFAMLADPRAPGAGGRQGAQERRKRRNLD